ncbi:helix-turn-helix domain-containing protein [Rhodococcus sp. G-MC3]|uniref:TetR/AcrR family transcriptional regulator n=1 Tax=Rhodococcus sp. G-MC3 TaxID=3046209 RepID=UPI0024B8B7BF|nr:TetR/AcrR family transcriptional regulator [Rhodococcus sp. G-MC3]MDJ0392677.1 helix-turn-helix domain-containing protein [Rhodococcus sp. G-MC3]
MSEAVKANRRAAVSDFKASAILEAAGRVFETEGLDGASMRAIAKEAGYTAGAIYAYFSSKEVLYAALLDQSLTRLAAAIEEADVRTLSAPERFVAAGLAFYDYYDENPRDLDLGFYLFRGGIKPRGLTSELDAELNGKLVASLRPITDAARGLGIDGEAARKVTADAFAHATGLLLLAHTRRLDLFGFAARDLLGEHLFALLRDLGAR